MKRILTLFLALSLVLVGCSDTGQEVKDQEESSIKEMTLYINGQEEEVQVLENPDNLNIQYRDELFVLSPDQAKALKEPNNTLLLTHDNQVLEDFDLNEVDKYKEFAKFYQVQLKNGETIQMFEKPQVDFPPVESNGSENIVDFYQHGDHWHVILTDGSEFVTYDDPGKIESKLDLVDVDEAHSGENKGLSFVEVVKLEDLEGIEIVEASIHDDHYHLFDSDGKEYLTYEDPSTMFPDLEITEYQGHDH